MKHQNWQQRKIDRSIKQGAIRLNSQEPKKDTDKKNINGIKNPKIRIKINN